MCLADFKYQVAEAGAGGHARGYCENILAEFGNLVADPSEANLLVEKLRCVRWNSQSEVAVQTEGNLRDDIAKSLAEFRNITRKPT